MAPAQGFICNEATVAAIGTSFLLVTLSGEAAAVAIDALARKRPSGGYWSYLEVNFTQTGAAPATCTYKLTWDAAGDVAASSEATITLTAGVTTGTKWGGASGLDIWPALNSSATATTNKVYLWVKVNAGTVTLDTARLYWRDHQGG